MKPFLSLAVLALALLAGVNLLVTGCGGGSAADRPLTVSAAASLTDAFPAYSDAEGFDARFSFAGSDELAAQIRQGAPVDVFAAANTDLPEALYEEGLVERPTAFATNSLVIAVATGSAVEAIDDLTEPGIDLIIGTASVPFGAYTREVLDRLSISERQAILANVRSEESDVKAAVGKLSQGAADAAFTYASDVAAASGQLRAVALPDRLQPRVTYAAAVVKGAQDPDAGRAFVAGLTGPQGREALREAGFGAPAGR
jgi:molybdate transport system substrate-binding protein